jgi:hypothetical protein
MQSILHLAQARLSRTLKGIGFARITPFLIVPAGLAGLTYFNTPEYKWWTDYFIIIQIFIFVLAQFIAFFQFGKLRVGAKKVSNVINVLLNGGEKPELKTLVKNLKADTNKGHFHDVVTRWLELGIRGIDTPFTMMMENAQYRRHRSVDKTLSFHININRTLLKLGFLGTLIGLTLTFDPMKDAILSLDGGGQGGFITKIAGAIDGNKFAIWTTLVATGLSIFLELITIQIFRRILSGFELVNNYMDEWNLTELQPWIREQQMDPEDLDKTLRLQQEYHEKVLEMYQGFFGKIEQMNTSMHDRLSGLYSDTQNSWALLQKNTTEALKSQQSQSENQMRSFQTEAVARMQQSQKELEQKQMEYLVASREAFQRTLGQAADELKKNGDVLIQSIQKLGTSVISTTESVDKLLPLQKNVGERIEELAVYESQYRAFLQLRSQVGVPGHLKPNKE